LAILLAITVWCLSEKLHHILWLAQIVMVNNRANHNIWCHFSDKHQTLMVNNIANHNIWCHFSDKHQIVMVNNRANHNIWCHF
jgi:hypothetical protein